MARFTSRSFSAGKRNVTTWPNSHHHVPGNYLRIRGRKLFREAGLFQVLIDFVQRFDWSCFKKIVNIIMPFCCGLLCTVGWLCGPARSGDNINRMETQQFLTVA